MSNISDTDSDADSYDSCDSDDCCFNCSADLSNTIDFVYCETDGNFYCIECYENQVWIE